MESVIKSAKNALFAMKKLNCKKKKCRFVVVYWLVWG